MRIKAVEGIKAYNRDGGSLRQTGCVCLRAYIRLFCCPPGYPYIRSSTDFGRPVDIECPVRFYPTVVLRKISQTQEKISATVCERPL